MVSKVQFSKETESGEETSIFLFPKLPNLKLAQVYSSLIVSSQLKLSCLPAFNAKEKFQPRKFRDKILKDSEWPKYFAR